MAMKENFISMAPDEESNATLQMWRLVILNL